MAIVGITAIQPAFLCRFDLAGDQIFCSLVLVLFACLLLWYVLHALSSRRARTVAGRGGRVVSRRKTPGGFWLMVCLYAALGMGMLYLVVSMDYHLFEKQAQNPNVASDNTLTRTPSAP